MLQDENVQLMIPHDRSPVGARLATVEPFPNLTKSDVIAC